MYCPDASGTPAYQPPEQISTAFSLGLQNPSMTPSAAPGYGQPYPQQAAPIHPTEWSSNLCACCDDPCNCCLTFWCPCITFGQIAEIVDEGSPPCAVSGGIYGVLLLFTGFACCYSCFYRTKMRAKFNLSDTPCTDCVVHCCCESCALCQEYRELKHRGYQPALGWAGNLKRQQRGTGTAMAVPVYPTMAR